MRTFTFNQNITIYTTTTQNTRNEKFFTYWQHKNIQNENFYLLQAQMEKDILSPIRNLNRNKLTHVKTHTRERSKTHNK